MNSLPAFHSKFSGCEGFFGLTDGSALLAGLVRLTCSTGDRPATTMSATKLKQKPRTNQPSALRFLFAATIALPPPKTHPDTISKNKNIAISPSAERPEGTKGNLYPIDKSIWNSSGHVFKFQRLPGLFGFNPDRAKGLPYVKVTQLLQGKRNEIDWLREGFYCRAKPRSSDCSSVSRWVRRNPHGSRFLRRRLSTSWTSESSPTSKERRHAHRLAIGPPWSLVG